MNNANKNKLIELTNSALKRAEEYNHPNCLGIIQDIKEKLDKDKELSFNDIQFVERYLYKYSKLRG